MVRKNRMRVTVAVSAVALMVSMIGVPAYALSDASVAEHGMETVAVVDDQQLDEMNSMPENPSVELPETIAEDIPDDAMVISSDLAVCSDGVVQDLVTGEMVTDPELVGTVDTPADPLAKTQGESFIPVAVEDVREAIEALAAEESGAENADAGNTSSNDDQAQVYSSALQDSSYGAYWSTYDGTAAFFQADGTLFAQQAKGIIDVSEWQGEIDWASAVEDGVEGAIIRIGYGWGNGFDNQAERNISECKRLGIPFGIYLYSYAYDSEIAAKEGESLVTLLKEAGVQPSDLSYPIFYDLEEWTWTGHTPPSSPSVYDSIVNTWYSTLQSAGYSNLSVYSYVNYLNSALNSSNIHGKTRWVASYGTSMSFEFTTNSRAWQYTSSGTVDGISGNVDLNAFGYGTYTEDDEWGEFEDIGTAGSSDVVGATDTNFYFANSLSGGEADVHVVYGRTGDVVLVGDWDGDGVDTLAVRRGRAYHIKNSISGGVADQVVYYGREGDEVLVGDWDGDGIDTLCVRRGRTYYFKNSISGGEADIVVTYGREGDEVLVGDWDGDGVDTLAVRRGRTYYVKNSISGGEADQVTVYGRESDTVLVGDWDGDGDDSFAVRRGRTYYVAYEIRSGNADVEFAYGREGDEVLVGDWDGDGKDTFCVRR